ncbi:hypothetical protein [Mycolicibacterium aubagnense]|uniref:Uncharacterized protein n=1 Tax=Mycolicibacterium aubagnense TaxID=319707 RepID=A0ABM7IJZ4_9MYCO|nr:hypothetical protein [Mycolicibacterium aubagnense]TLH48532.1 hypothetical protein C1S80_30050 [Mycolicibacterium aubagnense]WGI31589.1 hypothetical protein QDT91_20495 [Mycolicibacterium aubagnense]BBX86954.1 hypothetical protein MAUB_48270 [Mycolicibacterium aubagnense]
MTQDALGAVGARLGKIDLEALTDDQAIALAQAQAALIKPNPDPAEEVSETRSIGDVVGGWFREESFYRDVTTRTLSAILAALLAYLGAVALGYVGTPSPVAVFELGYAVATAICVASTGYAKATGRELLAGTLFVLYCVVAAAVFWYGPTWGGDLGWKDKWSWIALVLQVALMIGAFGFVRNRRKARATR